MNSFRVRIIIYLYQTHRNPAGTYPKGLRNKSYMARTNVRALPSPPCVTKERLHGGPGAKQPTCTVSSASHSPTISSLRIRLIASSIGISRLSFNCHFLHGGYEHVACQPPVAHPNSPCDAP